MAILAQGAVIKVEDPGSPGTFLPIAGPLDIEFTPPKPERVDVTNHDSTAREYLQGLSGDGSAKTSVQYDPAQPSHTIVRDLHGVSTPTNFEVFFKDGTEVDFAATVAVSFKLGISNKPEEMEIELTISGPVSYVDP